MKKFYVIAMCVLGVMALASCSKSEDGVDVPDQPKMVQLSFEAVQDNGGADTRSHLQPTKEVYWDENDQITVFSKNTGYSFETRRGGETVNFVGTVYVEDGTYYALYPYNGSATFDGTTIKTTLQAEQVVDDDLESGSTCSFAKGANITVASTLAEDMALSFKNVCGLIKFSISSEASPLPFNTATLQGLNSEKLAGGISITGVNTNTPTGTITGSNETITLRKNDGPFHKNIDYYIVVPPITFTNGYKITFSYNGGAPTEVWTVNDGSKTVVRSNILKAGTTAQAGVYTYVAPTP